MKLLTYSRLVVITALTCLRTGAAEPLLTPKQVWADYDPNKGEFNKETPK